MGLLSFTGRLICATAEVAFECVKEASNNIIEKQNEVRRASMHDLKRNAERNNLLGGLSRAEIKRRENENKS